ncbi:hypothetical protein QUB56_29015 [Microcoleus sp. AR_TQ3_B6]|uniref:hypothetical protein n=1 Tax=Microcoleus sp. AR_TQ3_B6 TaxID=3055284 RepID=UPI002FD16856
METVIAFIEEFIAQEYKASVALTTEPDLHLLETDIEILNQFFQGLDSGLNISSSRTLEEQDRVIRQLQPRVLFQIKQYAHSTLGTIYRVYLSSTFREDRDYFTNFYIANTGKGLKIVARYHICNTCNGKGKSADIICDECHGFGWKWRGGQQLNILGTLVTVRKFEPPIDGQHLQEYESV